MIYSFPSLATTASKEQMSSPPNISETWREKILEKVQKYLETIYCFECNFESKKFFYFRDIKGTVKKK